jgi:hypothetical protein
MLPIVYHTTRGTIRSSTRHTYRPSHMSTATATRRFGTQSARVCNEHVKHVVDQLHTSEVFGSGVRTSTESQGRPLIDTKPTQTEQLVWLAKHLLAGSTTGKHGVGNANGHEETAINNDKQGGPSRLGPSSAQIWDGPTVWAYLW